MNAPPNTREFNRRVPLDPIVLVHGAWHTPAVWDPVTELLEERGHRVAVPELPIESTTASGSDHAEIIAAACAGDDSPVVVCHTSGSLTGMLVPQSTAVRQFVHVNGLLPVIGSSFTDQTKGDDFIFGEDTGRMYDRDARSFWTDEARFGELLAHDCDKMTRSRLWDQLRRQARRPLTEVTPLTAWPSTPTSAILYSNDRDLPIEWLRRTAIERLGVEAYELPGSQLGFNARPQLFVKTLVKLMAQLPRRHSIASPRAS
ncbi:MAG: lipase family alpha/beta hydrolase [Solirubrobacterales bacterium]